MELRRTTGRLGERLALAALLLTLAGLLWVAGIVGAYGATCPPSAPVEGTQTSVSAWPPGKECQPLSGTEEAVVKPLFKGIEWLIVGVALIGVAILLGAVIAEIRRLRGSSRERAPGGAPLAHWP